MWVKICANTSAEDALKAAELGADAVGFVFAESARRVTPEQVREIAGALPAEVERIGVFSSGSVAQVAEATEWALLTGVQLHGGFAPEFAEALQLRLGVGIAIIPALHWTVGADDESATVVSGQLAELTSTLRPARVLVDARVGAGTAGGTGQSFNWLRAQSIFGASGAPHMILAGGLGPDNVADAIETLRPWGVDVASGVEREPGRKDFGKLRDFIERAGRAA